MASSLSPYLERLHLGRERPANNLAPAFPGVATAPIVAVLAEPRMSHAVAIIMGSRSDWPTMKGAAESLEALGVAFEVKIVSAHRTPERLYSFARGAKAAGFKVIIAGAGGAAHLPGMTASLTDLPVLGVPIQSKALNGLDSLLSIVQMPAGVPVGALAVGEAGSRNAGLLAAKILALSDSALAERLEKARADLAQSVPEHVGEGA
jgi:5-(carboxyamino)imidazole ribonucleotide mutase